MNKGGMKFDISEADFLPNPNPDMGNIKIFDEALGQSGRPFVVYLEDKPLAKRGAHKFIDDVTFIYLSGEREIEGEGKYKAGDVRFVPGGNLCGEEIIGETGGTCWVISASDPTPVDVIDEVKPPELKDVKTELEIPKYSPPYDWEKIEQDVKSVGVVILKSKLNEETLDEINSDIDRHLKNNDIAAHQSSSEAYDRFSGVNTTRVHALSSFSDSVAKLICEDDMVDSASRLMEGGCYSVRLSTAMVLQVNPGESAQYIHSDYKSWPFLEGGPIPLNITAMYALSDFTKENGATLFAPGSWAWPKNKNPRRDQILPAEMSAGDVALFRADVMHGAGANIAEDSRRGLFISYCAGWLRPVENSFLNIPRERLPFLPRKLLPLLGYAVHDSTPQNGGLIGQYMGGDPMNALQDVLTETE